MICRQTSSLLLASPFYSLKTKMFVKMKNIRILACCLYKKDVANER